jgi:capsular exopolysaccharide synthesis family protein
VADRAGAASAPSSRRGVVAPGGPSADALRSLRLSLGPNVPVGGVQPCLLFTSTEPGAGKSTLAANYALVASLTQTRVLLIDGDLRQPAIHEIFRLPRSPGLVELLSSGGRLEDFVVRSEASIGQLDILRAGQLMWRPGDLLSSPRMGDVLAEARRAYNLVVIDSPPLPSAPDAASLAAHGGVDVLLVVRRSTKRRAVREAARTTERVGANLRGVIVNREGRLSAYGY